jgi:hypothetical protein
MGFFRDLFRTIRTAARLPLVKKKTLAVAVPPRELPQIPHFVALSPVLAFSESAPAPMTPTCVTTPPSPLYDFLLQSASVLLEKGSLMSQRNSSHSAFLFEPRTHTVPAPGFSPVTGKFILPRAPSPPIPCRPTPQQLRDTNATLEVRSLPTLTPAILARSIPRQNKEVKTIHSQRESFWTQAPVRPQRPTLDTLIQTNLVLDSLLLPRLPISECPSFASRMDQNSASAEAIPHIRHRPGDMKDLCSIEYRDASELHCHELFTQWSPSLVPVYFQNCEVCHDEYCTDPHRWFTFLGFIAEMLSSVQGDRAMARRKAYKFFHRFDRAMKYCFVCDQEKCRHPHRLYTKEGWVRAQGQCFGEAGVETALEKADKLFYSFNLF